jgi:hypothetical protein
VHSIALFDVNILGMDGVEKLQALLGYIKRMALSEPMAGCAEHDMNNPSYTLQRPIYLP